MKRTLVAYGSKHGSTKEVATAIAADLRAAGHDVDLLSAGAAVVAGLDGYDSVVIGGSLYLGRWHPDVCRFMRRHRTALGRVPLAVFALGPRTLDTADVASSRKQLDAALERLEDRAATGHDLRRRSSIRPSFTSRSTACHRATLGTGRPSTPGATRSDR